MGGAVHLVRSSRQEACHAIAPAPVTCTTGIMLFLITTSGVVPIPARSCGSPVPPRGRYDRAIGARDATCLVTS